MKNILTIIFGCVWSGCLSQVLDQLLAGVEIMEVPFTDSIGFILNSEHQIIDAALWESVGLDALEKFKENYTYSIWGYINNASSKLILISRAFEEENIHWICIFENNKLTDWLITAYDNSEGFLTINSRIEEERIILNTRNDFANEKQVIKEYQVSDNQFLCSPKVSVIKINYQNGDGDSSYYYLDFKKQKRVDLDFLVEKIAYPPKIPANFYWQLPDTTTMESLEIDNLFYKYRFDESGKVILWYYLGSYISGIFPRPYMFNYDEGDNLIEIYDPLEKEAYQIYYDRYKSIKSVERINISGSTIEKLIINYHTVTNENRNLQQKQY